MEAQLKALNLKLDQVLDMQQTILKSLGQYNMLSKETVNDFKIQNDKESEIFSKEYFYLTLKKGQFLKEKFNLKTTPRSNKVMAYLRTNDPKIFDGLKRNNK